MAKDPKEEKVTQEEEQKAKQEEQTQQEEKASQDSSKEQESQEEAREEKAESTKEAKDEQKEPEVSPEEKLKAELQEFKDKYLRLYSEFDNYRKRTAKEKADFMKSANRDLILSLLPTLDDWKRADKAFDPEKADASQVKEGYDLIFQKFSKVLEKEGVTPIEVQKGDDFDVEKHEAVTQFPAPSEDLKGKVVDELEKGYQLGDKVIRFSKVVVGS